MTSFYGAFVIILTAVILFNIISISMHILAWISIVLYLYGLHGAVRNEKQAKNSQWKYMFQTGIEPAAPRFESWYLSPLGHTAEMLINAV